MKYLSLLVLIFALIGCEHTPVVPEQPIAERVEYVIKVPPAALMTLPPTVAPIDLDSPLTKESTIAQWITAGEARVTALENQIIGIAKFFTTEQKKLDDKAKTENQTK